MRLTGSRAYTRPTQVPKMPVGLVEMMEGLTKDVLKNNPPDVYEFCADHMYKLLELRDGPTKKIVLTLDEKIARAQEKLRKRADARWQEYLKARNASRQNSENNGKIKSSITSTNENVAAESLSTPLQQNILKPPVHQDLNESEIEISHDPDVFTFAKNVPTGIVTNEHAEPDSVLEEKNNEVHKEKDLLLNTSKSIEKNIEEQEVIVIPEKLNDGSLAKVTEQPLKNDATTLEDANISKIDNDENVILLTINGEVHEDNNESFYDLKADILESNGINENGLHEQLKEDKSEMYTKDIDCNTTNVSDISENKEKLLDQENLQNVDNHQKNNINNSSTDKLNTDGKESIEGLNNNKEIHKITNEINSDCGDGVIKENNIENCKDDKVLEDTIVPGVDATESLKRSSDDHKDEIVIVQNLSNEPPNSMSSEFILSLTEPNPEDYNHREDRLQEIELIQPKKDILEIFSKSTLDNIAENSDENVGNELVNKPHELKNTDLPEQKLNEDEIFEEKGEITNGDVKEHVNDSTESTNENIAQRSKIDEKNKSDIKDEALPNHKTVHIGNGDSPQDKYDEKKFHLQNTTEQPETELEIQDNQQIRSKRDTSESISNDNTDRETLSSRKSVTDEMSTEENDNHSFIESGASEIMDDIIQNTDRNTDGMDLETAAVTIQKVFRTFLFKSRASTFDDTNDENMPLDDDNEKKDEIEFQPTNMNVGKERRGISRMDTVLQTVNEEKSLSLSTDDSSTLSSAATTIQAHVRGFLVRNKLYSHKTGSTNSLANSNGPSITSLDGDVEQNKNKTILNIHIVPEGNYLSRDESMLTSMDLSMDSSPPSSLNLHPLGYDRNERRKQLKREDAIQSISPPSNNSGKLSEDVDSVKDLVITDGETLANQKELNEKVNADKRQVEPESGDTSPTLSTTIETIIENHKIDDEEGADSKTDVNGKNRKRTLTKMSSDEMDVVTPFEDSENNSSAESHNTPKLMHSGEFHDVLLPTKVSRHDSSVVSGE